MNLEEIKAFLAITKYGSMSAAAEKLFISQTTLSGRIKQLENELGVTLFVRGKGVRSSELTNSGRDLLPIAKSWENLWRETENIANLSKQRVFSFISVPSVDTHLMASTISQFVYKNQDVYLNHSVNIIEACYDSLETGICEVAFVTEPYVSNKVDIYPIISEPYVLLVNKKAKVKDKVSLDDLNRGTEVYIEWNSDFAKWHKYWIGNPKHTKIKIHGFSVLEDILVAREDCWGIAPLSIANYICMHGGVKMCPLEEPPEDKQIYMILRKSSSGSSELYDFLQCLYDESKTQNLKWILDTSSSSFPDFKSDDR